MLPKATRPLGEWLPDMRNLRSDGLLEVDGLWPTEGGYRRWFSLEPKHGGIVPSTRVRGEVIGQSNSGSVFAACGDETQLYAELANGFVIKSRTGGYSLDFTARWSMLQFSDTLYAATVTGSPTPLQYIDLETISGPTLFQDHPDSRCPIGRFLAQSKSFLFLGDLQQKGVAGPGDESSPDPHYLYWFPVGNPLQNPLPDIGTDAAFQVQSDRRIFDSGGGPINAVIGAGELVYVFQRNRVSRGDFVGGDVVWRFDPIEKDRGLPLRNLICSRGQAVYFWSSDGFRVTRGGESAEIGYNKIDRFFREDVDFDREYLFSSYADPQRPLIMFAYASLDNDEDYANRLLIYNSDEQRWSLVLDQRIDVLTSVFAADSIGSPDDVPGLSPDSVLPNGDPLVGNETPDSLVTDPVSPRRLGAYKFTHERATYNGPLLVGKFVTADWPINGAQIQTYLRTVRILGDAPSSALRVGTKVDQRQAFPDYSMVTQPSRDGRAYFRAVGLSHRIEGVFASVSEDVEIHGLEVEHRPARRVGR